MRLAVLSPLVFVIQFGFVFAANSANAYATIITFNREGSDTDEGMERAVSSVLEEYRRAGLLRGIWHQKLKDSGMSLCVEPRNFQAFSAFNEALVAINNRNKHKAYFQISPRCGFASQNSDVDEKTYSMPISSATRDFASAGLNKRGFSLSQTNHMKRARIRPKQIPKKGYGSDDPLGGMSLDEFKRFMEE